MADSETNSGEVFEVERIRNLVELMKEFDLREIDLRESEQRIRLCRGSETVVHNTAIPAGPVPPRIVRPVGERPSSATSGRTPAIRDSVSCASEGRSMNAAA